MKKIKVKVAMNKLILIPNEKNSHNNYESFFKNWRRSTLPLSQYHRRWWA